MEPIWTSKNWTHWNVPHSTTGIRFDWPTLVAFWHTFTNIGILPVTSVNPPWLQVGGKRQPRGRKVSTGDIQSRASRVWNGSMAWMALVWPMEPRVRFCHRNTRIELLRDNVTWEVVIRMRRLPLDRLWICKCFLCCFRFRFRMDFILTLIELEQATGQEEQRLSDAGEDGLEEGQRVG